MRFLNRFEKYNEMIAISEYENIQNNILDKISDKGIKSLSRLEKGLLKSISNDDLEYIKDFKKRENEYLQIIKGDIRDEYSDITMSDKELIEFNAETLWDLIEEIDLDHFATIYNYPVDIADFTWEKLPRKIKKHFIEYSLTFKD